MVASAGPPESAVVGGVASGAITNRQLNAHEDAAVTVAASRKPLLLIGEQPLRGLRLVAPAVAVTADIIELLPETIPGVPEQSFDLRAQGV